MWPSISYGRYVNEIKLKSDELNTQNNLYNEDAQAVLLLSTFFSKPKKGEARPLTAIEYGRFARWLHEFNYTPSSLFHQFDEVLSKWKDPKGKITADRLSEILGRKAAMGLALEKWQRAGVWVITRQDSEYPQLLKKQLRHISPPVFFGVGNKGLLQQGGLAIIGSRGIDEIDEEFTKNIAIQAAKENINIVSGAAQGVDETAMLASLNAGGTAIGIMADSLLKAATASKWRNYLQSEKLVLISSFYPEAGFSVGNAMARNKYIYTTASSALVVRADEGKGGTWAGAKENNENNWVPLFVNRRSNASGNIALLAHGAHSLELQKTSEAWLAEVLSKVPAPKSNNSPSNSLNLFE
ncbi:DNA-processing protein DprA [Salinicola halophilus]|uniref:DNA-processing protein DprA n=1 Tax=Salinicola halophilus TaxID=184065 RepID=UPI000DA23FF8|nr:DNA-processing protein DprA [Salinicola halophilus]